MAFPVSADSFPTILSSTKQDDSGFEADILLNRAFDAIEAIEAKVGIGSTVPAAGTVLRGGSGLSAWSAIETGDIANNAITIRPTPAVGSTDPTTTNTTVAALANPTLSITIPAGMTADVYVWVTGFINDSGGGTIVEYSLRIGGGSWVTVAATSPASSAGRHPLSGFHVFEDVTAGAKTIEVGNASSTGANTITHYGSARRLMAIGVMK